MNNSSYFKFVIAGVVLIILSILILWWNENMGLNNDSNKRELENAYIEITSKEVSDITDGELVVMSDNLTSKEMVADSLFGISINSPKLERIVEMYSWKETESKEGIIYEKVWQEALIDSDSFEDQTKVNLKNKPYNSEYFIADVINIGAYKLNNDQKNKLIASKRYTELSEIVASGLGYTIKDNYYTNSEDYSNPIIGDIRISFKYIGESPFTVMAEQINDSFISYVTKSGEKINYITEGNLSGVEMLSKFNEVNVIVKWGIRAFGLVLAYVGFLILLYPLYELKINIPVINIIIKKSYWASISFLLAISIPLLVIGLSWITYKVLIGAGLLVGFVCVYGGIAYLLLLKADFDKKIKEQKNRNENLLELKNKMDKPISGETVVTNSNEEIELLNINNKDVK